LLCPECHHQTFGRKDEFSELTEQAIENLKVLIEKGLSKELSGAHMERERLHEKVYCIRCGKSRGVSLWKDEQWLVHSPYHIVRIILKCENCGKQWEVKEI